MSKSGKIASQTEGEAKLQAVLGTATYNYIDATICMPNRGRRNTNKGCIGPRIRFLADTGADESIAPACMQKYSICRLQRSQAKLTAANGQILNIVNHGVRRFKIQGQTFNAPVQFSNDVETCILSLNWL